MSNSSLPPTLIALTLLLVPAGATAQTSAPDDASEDSAAEQTSDDEKASSDEKETEESSGEEENAEADQGESEDQAETGDRASDQDEAGGETESAEEKAGDRESAQSPQQETSGDDADEAASEDEKQTETTDQQSGQTRTENEETPAQEETSADEETDEPAGPPATPQTPEMPEGEEANNDENEDDEQSPISDLAEDDDEGDGDGFQPVEDIEEDSLQELIPADVYPYLEWDGFFRVRTEAAVNFDLGTGGTSSILPPAETYLPPGTDPRPVANEDANLLWSSDTNLLLDPTIHISESLAVHVEAELLDNVVLGSLSDRRLTNPRLGIYRPDPSRTVYSADQIPPREREWFQSSLRINEAWGEIDTFLGNVRAGRMDNHWGLGMHANDGDCLDCNFGDHVDRIQFLTKPLGIYASAAIDFPDQGPTTQSPGRVDEQPYDLGQIDDAQQYTFSVFRKPRTDKDKKIRQQTLKDEQKPVIDGGARFTYRTQDGLAVPQNRLGDPSAGAGNRFNLVYRGLDMYVPDLWAEFLYNPDPDTYVRVGLETVGVFGNIDNTSGQPVGRGTGEEDGINCFNQATRDENPGRCQSDSATLTQLGAALESEVYLGGPVRFGLNSGLASGGDDPNWGYQTPAGTTESGPGGINTDFYRFDPNYHVDLILFREVIGTVTNAYYFNPYAQARFFESSDQRMEVQLDAIASGTLNSQGTPARRGNLLGLEFDGAVRYLQTDRFTAEVEGGILFPFDPLDARLGNARLTQPGDVGPEFSNNIPADLAWTVQGNLAWQF